MSPGHPSDDIVARAADRRCAVLMDGGIRRGTDVLKALALDADAVLLGRRVLRSLTVDGQAGVEHMLALLRAELEQAMVLSGVSRIRDLPPDLLHRRAS